jgi:hypothetical protein
MGIINISSPLKLIKVSKIRPAIGFKISVSAIRVRDSWIELSIESIIEFLCFWLCTNMTKKRIREIGSKKNKKNGLGVKR